MKAQRLLVVIKNTFGWGVPFKPPFGMTILRVIGFRESTGIGWKWGFQPSPPVLAVLTLNTSSAAFRFRAAVFFGWSPHVLIQL